VFGLLSLLAGCASTGPAPVRDLGLADTRAPIPIEPERSPQATPGFHRVRRGDTLYSIAFRNGLDYRDIAAWNDIAPPYTIRVGEDLRLASPPGRTVSATPPRPAPRMEPRVASIAGVPKPAPFQPVPSTDAATPATPPSAASSAGSSPRVVAAPAPTAMPPRPPDEAVAERTASGEPAWRWPANGKLVATFAAGDPVRQGIDIAGNAGDPVRAASGGTVVYSGNGLLGYGELIIIKHDSTWLSAYGHNRKRLVTEGQRVAAGEVIAEMGASSASRNALHFEVRRKGKPVDPLDHLPRR
jgi:lipoprotein NlpD